MAGVKPRPEVPRVSSGYTPLSVWDRMRQMEKKSKVNNSIGLRLSFSTRLTAYPYAQPIVFYKLALSWVAARHIALDFCVKLRHNSSRVRISAVLTRCYTGKAPFVSQPDTKNDGTFRFWRRPDSPSCADVCSKTISTQSGTTSTPITDRANLVDRCATCKSRCIGTGEVRPKYER